MRPLFRFLSLKMQAYSHFISAILIHILLINFSFTLQIFIIFLSHFLLDFLAYFTYHPPRPLFNKFWIIYHFSLLFITIYILYYYGLIYYLYFFFSILIDLWDYLIIRPLLWLGVSEMEMFRIHRLIEYMREYYLKPYFYEQSYNPFTIIYEVIFNLIMIGLMFPVENYIEIYYQFWR